MLLGMESVWLEAECARYEFFFDVISQSSPDVVVISLDSDQNKALQLIAQLAQVSPDLPILAVSAKGDGQAILQALRSGAREFLTAPVVLEELLKALQRLQPRPTPTATTAASDERRRPRSIRRSSPCSARAAASAAPASPSTSAATLAQDPTHSVALVDLDLALGDADVALDLMADYTLADVAMNVERLDMQFLRRSLSKHASRPVAVAAPGADGGHRPDPRGLICSASSACCGPAITHLVLDLSKSFAPTDVTALRMADVILLVAQLELTSLRNVVRMLQTLGNDDAAGGKVQGGAQPRRRRDATSP